jgi:O-antigen/teichoic acid export membrane protein
MFLAGGSLFNAAVSIFTTSVIAKSIGAEMFGKYTFGLSFIVLFSVLSNFGLESLFVRDAAKDKEKIHAMLYDILCIKVILAVATIGIMIMFSYVLSYDESTILVIKVMAVGLFLQIISDILLATYKSVERMKIVSFYSVLFRTVTAACIFVSVFYGFGFWGIVWSFTIGKAVVFLSLVFHFYFNFGLDRAKVNVREWFSLTRRGMPFYLSALFTMVYMKGTVIFLSKMRGEYDIGIYMAAATLVESLMFLPLAFNISIFPAFARIYSQSAAELNKAYFKSMKYVLIVAGAVSVGSVLVSPKIILLIFGKEFSSSAVVLNILIFYWMLTFLSQMMSNLLFSVNMENAQVKVMGLACLLNIVMNFLLVPRFGPIGSALSFLATEFAIVVFISILLWRKGICYLPDMNTVRLVPVLLLMAGAVKLSWGLNVFVNITIGGLVFFGALFLLRVFDDEDMYNLRLLFGKRA